MLSDFLDSGLLINLAKNERFQIVVDECQVLQCSLSYPYSFIIIKQKHIENNPDLSKGKDVSLSKTYVDLYQEGLA